MPEHKRSYRVGNRRADLGKGDARMSEGRWAWVRNHLGQFVILVDESDDSEPGTGRTIRLFHPREGRPGVSWNLTALTEEELRKLKQLFDSAFEWALPIVVARDKEAKRAFEEDGDDSYSRFYRQLSQLVYRKGPESEHSEGVQHRPEGVSGLAEGSPEVDDDSSAGHGDGVRRDGDAVVEPHAAGSLTPDDWPTIDQPPSLRPMVGTPESAARLQDPDPSEGSASPDPGAVGRPGEDAGGSQDV